MTMFSMAGNTPDRTLSIIYGNGDTATVPETHARFDELVSLLLSGAEDAEVGDLVDLMLSVSKKLEQLPDRVSIKGRTILFDGDPLRGELADVLVELHEAGNAESLRPVVNFLEKAATNPSRKSVDDLYRWITKGDLIIHEDGDFLAYKAVQLGEDGVPKSISQGTAFVNGEEVTGNIPNPIGAIVTMPRSQVDDNENEACSTGLHVGTHSYAEWFKNVNTNTWRTGYGEVVILLGKVNPRDVVSVPSDSEDRKIRTCRYEVREIIENRLDSHVYVESVGLEEEGTDIQPDAEWDLDQEPDVVDGQEELDFDGEEESDEPHPEEDRESDQWLETLRQKLSRGEVEESDWDYTEPLTEAELEAQRQPEEPESTLRDSKGRFTTEGSRKAVRNSKGQFVRWS